MQQVTRFPIVFAVAMFSAGAAVGAMVTSAVPTKAEAQAPPARVFELRTYTAPDGKLADLHARFRNHTLRIFAKHGMTNVIYLAPMDAPLKDNTLIYLLAHKDRDAAKASWDAFRNDPEWKQVAAESQKNGPLTTKVESVFLTAADYSPMK
jgi:hypothetical protein